MLLWQVPIKYKISYIRLPIIEIRQLRRLCGIQTHQGARGRGRALGRGQRLASLKKKGELMKIVVWKKWPVMMPSDMTRALIDGGAETLLPLAMITSARAFTFFRVWL